MQFDKKLDFIDKSMLSFLDNIWAFKLIAALMSFSVVNTENNNEN